VQSSKSARAKDICSKHELEEGVLEVKVEEEREMASALKKMVYKAPDVPLMDVSNIVEMDWKIMMRSRLVDEFATLVNEAWIASKKGLR